MSQGLQIGRNPFRKRHAPRARVKTNIHTLGMVEALEARRQGLDEMVADTMREE